MMIPRSLRILLAAMAVLLLLGIVGCKSTPDPKTEPVIEEPEPTKPEPAPEPTPEPEQEQAVLQPEALSQDDINAGRAAVQRAKLMGANTWFPIEYRKLLADLNNGLSLGNTDPDSARAALLEVIEDANELYNKTLIVRRNDYEAKYRRADNALKEIKADKFAPAEYAATHVMAGKTLVLFNAHRYAEAQIKGNETLEAQQRLHYNLKENIRYIGILRRDTENYLGDAEDNEAFIYAPDELEAANIYYFDGVSAYRDYDLKGSAEILTLAKRQAILAARTAAVGKRQAETDALMSDTQRRIEEASRLRVITDDGIVEDPRPWDGDDYIETNPLVDHSQDVGTVDIEEPRLRDLNIPIRNNNDGAVPQDVPISDSETQVNADEQDTDYLMFAQTLWGKGVTARNNGQFDLAQDFFRQAQAYIDVYETHAVSRTYTVVYREVAADCLWRIAEMGDIFDNPFLWPKIWRANRRIIQNPDLIYPGQVLAIPPK